jgi:hypothetical protein
MTNTPARRYRFGGLGLHRTTEECDGVLCRHPLPAHYVDPRLNTQLDTN